MRTRLRILRPSGRKQLMALLALLLLPVTAGISLAGLEIGDPVVCNAVFTGGAGTSAWETPANWQTGALPGTTDTACLSGAVVEVRSPVVAGAVNGGELHLLGGGLTLSGASELNALSIGGGTLAVGTSLTVHGPLGQTGGDVTGTGALSVEGPWTWTGGVQSGAGTSYAYTLELPSGTQRTISGRDLSASAVTFTGDGSIRFAGDNSRLTSLGDLIVDRHRAELLGAGSVAAHWLRVNGTADAAGSLTVEPTYETQDLDSILVQGTGALRLETPGTQHGAVKLQDQAQLILEESQTFAAGSTVAGASGSLLSVFRGTTTFAGTAQLGQLENLATVGVAAGASATEVNNQGDLSIADGKVFDVHGPAGYAQGAGADPNSPDANDGVRTSLSGAGAVLVVRNGGQLTLDGGELTGNGKVAGPVTNKAGTVVPVGTLRVAGAYTQGGAASLEITRRDGGAWDRLAVDGTATLDGSLSLPTSGLVPTAPVDVLTTSSRVGQFGLVLGDLIRCGSVGYSDTAVTLQPGSCVSVEDATAAEAAATLRFPVTLTQPAASPVSVRWSTVDGTAKAGTDFAAASGTVTIPAGETSTAIDVALLDDTTHEDTETFSVSLSSDAVLTRTSAQGTITDDDEAPLQLEVRDVLADINSASVTGIGTSYVVGFEGYDADNMQSWAWRIEDGGFAYQPNVASINGINSDDDVVGWCPKPGGSAAACFRSNKVTTWLKSPPGNELTVPHAVNRNDVIIGYFGPQALRWATPGAAPEAIGPGDGNGDQALVLSDSGYIGGTTVFGSGSDVYSNAWVRDPDDRLTMIGPLTAHPQFRFMSPTAVAENGTVYGYAHDGSLWPGHSMGWKWTADGGLVELGVDNGISDTNAAGQAVGTLDNVPTLIKADGKKVDLRTALAPGQNWRLLGVGNINDQGVIVGLAVRPNSSVAHIVALTPPGAGCALCVDLNATEGRYPNPMVRVPVDQSTVDGNPVALSAVVRNATTTSRTVAVTILDQNGAPLGNTRTLALAPDTSSGELTELWRTDGLAWDAAGKPTAPQVVSVQVKDTGGGAVTTYEKAIRVDPRPVVTVHGMNSDATTWAAYPQFLHNVNPHWNAYAVDTMDTKPWTPNTIKQNAAQLADFVQAKQVQDNAWHVDVVAHSMGGLISRYYIQNLMPTNLDGSTAVHRLVMLGTPNAGSPCADLFDVPLTKELRTDDVARFNQEVTDRRGIPFSVAAGVHVPVTCDTLQAGDDVVPVDSAHTGIDDWQLFEVMHTAMTASPQLFGQFVLPRLNGTYYPTGGASTAAAATKVAATKAMAAKATTAAATAAHSPQLLQIDPMTLEPGQSTEIPLTVPDSATSAGLGLAAAPLVTVEVLKDGATVATLPAAAPLDSLVRTVDLPGPVPGRYTMRFTNTGDATVQTESSVWAAGLPTRVVATARPVAGTGKTINLQVTAALTGELPAAGQTAATGTLNQPDGTTRPITLYDDGQHGDGAAGDNMFGTVVSDVSPGTYAASVFLVTPKLTLATIASADAQLVEDLPGDQAPVVASSTVVTSRDRSVQVPLDAIDPEGASLTYQLVTMPAHGSLGGDAPSLTYQPAKGYLGTDSFTWRASDGANWSATVTVTITVGPAATQLVYQSPFPAQGTVGGKLTPVVRLSGPLLEAVNGVPVQFTLGGHTVTGTTGGRGEASAALPLDLAPGQYDLVMSFAGASDWAPATVTQRITVIGGSAPQPSLPDGASGEAGYPMRLRISGNDPDGDAARFQIDYTNDGVWDAESGPLISSGVAWFDHTYPEAVDGTVRVRVTDAAGNSTEHVEPLHVAPHRPLGPLSLAQVNGAPVNGVALSDDGKKALVQVRDTEGHTAVPTPYRLLDLATGASVPASVAPNGTQVDFPVAGAVSTDGRYVAFSTTEMVNGFASAQAYLRDMSTGTTTRISVRPDGTSTDNNTWPVDVSTDGRWVLVVSNAHGYVADSVDRCTGGPCTEAYLLDTQTHNAVLLSRDANGHPSTEVSASAAMTPDAGLAVASGRNRVVLYDRAAGTSTALPVAGTGDLPDVTGAVSDLDLSDDGRYVLFGTQATGLEPSDTTNDVDVYRYDRTTGTRVLISVTPAGTSPNQSANEATMDGSGTRIAFSSTASDLVAGATGTVGHVYLRDATLGTTSRISQEARDGIAGQHGSGQPLLAGQTLLFSSDAANLVPGDIDGERDLFRYQLDPPTPPNTAPVVTLPDATVAEGGSLALTATASDVDGDPLTYTWSSDSGTLSGSGATVQLAAGDGPADLHVTVTVSDGKATTQATATVHVTNADPVVDAGGDVTVPWGVPAKLHGSVTDPSTADTAAGLSPRWTFDDGTGADGLDASHAWAAPGTGTATLTATDRDGGTGSGRVTVTVTKRPSAVKLTADPGGFGFASASAVVTDPLAGPLAGRQVTFTVDGKALAPVVTDANGTAVVPAGALLPGTHNVSAAVAEDALYLAGKASTTSVTVTNTPGKVTGGVSVAEGSATVDANSEGKTLKGRITWQGAKDSLTVDVTAIGIGADGRSAWISGTDGTHTVLVYVEDNGEPGVDDVLRVWVDGVSRTATGQRLTGNLQVHKPKS